MKQLSGIYFWSFVLLFVSLSAASCGFGLYLFPAIAPEMIKEVGFTYSQMGITTGAVQASFLIFALASGLLTSVIGVFRIIKASIILCAISLFGLIWANDFLLISIFLVLMGGAASSVWVPMIDVSQKYISSKHQGRVLGLMSSGTGYGVFINSVLIFYLLDKFGWRALWVSTFAIILFICICTFIILRNVENHICKLDKPSGAIDPVQKSSVWKKISTLPFRMTSIVILMMFLNGLSCTPFQTYLSSFLVSEHGASIDKSAVAWSLIGAVGMVSGFIMGWIADRITVRWSLVIVYSLLSASTLLLLYSKAGFLSAILFGFSFYAIYGLVPAYISHVYKKGMAVLVFAFGNVALGLGGIVGNALGGWLKEKYGSFEWIYLIILIASLVSIIISILMRGEQNTSHRQLALVSH